MRFVWISMLLLNLILPVASFAAEDMMENMVMGNMEDMVNDEGYGNTDEEYIESEVNAEAPDEYLNDEMLTNEEAEMVNAINEQTGN